MITISITELAMIASVIVICEVLSWRYNKNQITTATNNILAKLPRLIEITKSFKVDEKHEKSIDPLMVYLNGNHIWNALAYDSEHDWVDVYSTDHKALVRMTGTIEVKLRKVQP